MKHSSSKINRILIVFLNGILAGVCIGIGGLLFLKTKEYTNNTVLGALFFSIGLILICNFGFFLYTGKICYLFDYKSDEIGFYALQLITGIIGNYLGALGFASLCKLMNLVPNNVFSMIDLKMQLNWYELIIRGIFCGMLIYFAVEGFKVINNNFGKYVVLIMCVAGFIICGFEHCIANIFYISLDNTITLQSFIMILYVIIGNTIGGLIVPLVNKVVKKLERGNDD